MSTALVPRLIAALALVLAARTAAPWHDADAGRPGRAPAVLASLDGGGEIQWPRAPDEGEERSVDDARRARSHGVATPVMPGVVPHAARTVAVAACAPWAHLGGDPRSADPGWPVRLRAPPA